MSHKWILGSLAAFALAQVTFAAGPSHFRAAPAFDGKTLAGWHPVGQADWRVDKGEIVGTPKTPAGGWLVLDKSYQDTGFFASFRCMTGCKTGVMLRADKTADGMKGSFISLNEGDLVSYSLKLDAQGQEASRQALRGGAGTVRMSAAAAAGGRGGGGGGAPGGAGRGAPNAGANAAPAAGGEMAAAAPAGGRAGRAGGGAPRGGGGG